MYDGWWVVVVGCLNVFFKVVNLFFEYLVIWFVGVVVV